MRYLLLDRILEVHKLSRATGIKCISLSEDCFEHHFPGQPIYPGALLVEAMAQLGGALLEISLKDRMDYMPRCVLSTVKAKFRSFAVPGDRLVLEATILSRRQASAQVRATCQRDGEVLCEAEMIFVYLKVDDQILHRSRNDLLQLLTRDARIFEPGTE